MKRSPAPVRLSMAAALARFLPQQYIRRDGVEHRLINGVWGIFGHGNVTGFGQALEEYGGRALPYLQAKNEQAMVHAAVAFAKTRQRLGTFACTSSIGPGATNMVTGAGVATVNRLPVLLLPGDIFANRRPGPVLQQLEYPGSHDVSVNDCFRPVSKFWDRINRPEQLLTALPEAMRILADPAETGAVTLALPEDVQAETGLYPANFFEKRVYTVERPPCAAEPLAEAVALLRRARRPLVIAGGGVHYSDATAVLARLAEATGLPVCVTQAGKSAILDSHPGCVGAVGVTGTAAANALAVEADVVLCLGTRLSDFTTASKSQFQHPRVRFIAVNIHAADARKHGAVPLVGDAQAVLLQLARALAGWQVPAAHAARIRKLRTAWDATRATLVAPHRDVPLTQAQVIEELNQACGADGTVIHASGGIPGDIHKLWRSHAVTDYHSEYGFSCMGYEIPGGIGMKLAQPDREVVVMVGDGSYMMMNSELATSVMMGVKLIVVLLDNRGYGCINRLQHACGGERFNNLYDYNTFQEESPQIDFVMHARSQGALARKASSLADLEAALVEAKAAARTSVIVIDTDPMLSTDAGGHWWEVAVPEVSVRPEVKAARQKYEDALANQRVGD